MLGAERVLHVIDAIQLLAEIGADTEWQHIWIFSRFYITWFKIMIICFVLQLQADMSEIVVLASLTSSLPSLKCHW